MDFDSLFSSAAAVVIVTVMEKKNMKKMIKKASQVKTVFLVVTSP